MSRTSTENTRSSSSSTSGSEETTLDEIVIENSSLRTASASEYLSQLTKFGLPQLLSEPASLQTQSHHLTSSLTSLTHTSYPTFLALHQTTSSLSTSLSSLQTTLDSLLLNNLPDLEKSSNSWKTRTEGVLEERRKARVVLEQYEKIRDLLDIPLLIDTCVRNEHYAEALSLAAHAASLNSESSIKSRATPAIIHSINAEVAQSMNAMLLTLLSTLHEPNRKLPALWKAVSFIRKTSMFDSGEEIALAFLVGRGSCLQSALDGCGRDIDGFALGLHNVKTLGDRPPEDVAKYLKRYSEVWREGVHDIVAQFTSIFLERGNETRDSSKFLITTYATHSLTSQLFPVLRRLLPLIGEGGVKELETQLKYCANAFAKFGLDFGGLLESLLWEITPLVEEESEESDGSGEGEEEKTDEGTEEGADDSGEDEEDEKGGED